MFGSAVAQKRRGRVVCSLLWAIAAAFRPRAQVIAENLCLRLFLQRRNLVVKQLIEPDLDQIFLADSYGYRPKKSALDAVGVTRERCWKYGWVLEFDIKGLFYNIDSCYGLSGST